MKYLHGLLHCVDSWTAQTAVRPSFTLQTSVKKFKPDVKHESWPLGCLASIPFLLLRLAFPKEPLCTWFENIFMFFSKTVKHTAALLGNSTWVSFILYPNPRAEVVLPMRDGWERRKLLNTQKFTKSGLFFKLSGTSWSRIKGYGDTHE